MGQNRENTNLRHGASRHHGLVGSLLVGPLGGRRSYWAGLGRAEGGHLPLLRAVHREVR